MPMSYFLSNKGVDAKNLATLIKMSVDKLVDATLDPVAIVCDQGTSNVFALKALDSRMEKPFFIHNQRKIYTVFDAPHLFKSLRNNILNGNFEYDGKIISFQDITETYNLDIRSTTARMLTKITDAHINPNTFQKMSCKLALQIFSSTMAAALRTSFFTGQIKRNTVLNTAEFIEILNHTFDCLNSKHRFTRNPYSCAISQNIPIVTDTLKNTKIIMNKL